MKQHLKIAVDARCLNRTRIRGIGKVLQKIIELSDPRTQWLLLGDRPDLELHLPQHPCVDSRVMEQRGYRFNAWEQYRLPAIVRQEKPDILLCPANSAPYKQTAPTIAIIHDTIPWTAHEPSEPTRGRLRSTLDHRAFKTCRAIITISRSSARDITQLWPDIQNKLEIIPNGIDRTYLDESHTALSANLERRGIRPPFFIYCGGPIPRKRASWAMDAFEQADVGNSQLVLCGVEESDLPKLQQNTTRTKSIITPGYIPEKEMPCLFQNSLGVLYPTLYEGFGLPAIEAQASGVACLMSPVSSLTELAGPGTITLPTNNKYAWTQAMNQLYLENGLKASDSHAARQWSQRYCWKRRAKQYAQLFSTIASKTSTKTRD